MKPAIAIGLVGNAFFVQQVPDHLARSPAGGKDRERIAAQGVHRPRDIDPAAAGIIARRLAAQFERGDDAVGGGRDVERRVHRQGDDCGHGRAPSDKGYWAASGAPAACCSASCTTAIVCKMLAAVTLIESIPSRARNCAISG